MSDDNLYLNLGSGQRPFAKPFINIDIQHKWKPDIVADCSKLDMFEDGSAQCIVLHHVLEHFGCGESLPLLVECRRLLSKTGSVIITVPDMSALAHGFVEGRITSQIYLTSVYGAYMSDEADRHKWGFTYYSLSDILTRAGFFSRPLLYRSIPGGDIAMDWWILAVEAYI